MKRITTTLLLLLSLLIMTSCSNRKIEYNYPTDPQNDRNFRAGRFFDDIVVYGDKKKPQSDSKISNQDKNNKNGKNSLWIASFEVLSSLFPVAVADSNSGIIITDWYMDGKNENSRIKINLLIKGLEIKEENLKISIFRQERNNKNEWQDKELNDNDLATKLIKEKIINKVRERRH